MTLLYVTQVRKWQARVTNYPIVSYHTIYGREGGTSITHVMDTIRTSGGGRPWHRLNYATDCIIYGQRRWQAAHEYGHDSNV